MNGEFMMSLKERVGGCWLTSNERLASSWRASWQSPIMNHTKILTRAFLLVAIASVLLSAQGASPIQYFYDDLGRLVTVVDQNGNVASYAYDAVGNLLSITRSTLPGRR